MSVYPDQIIVLGGGRWARVIVGVLCDFVPNGIPILLCSPRGYSDLLEWVHKRSNACRLSIQDQWPEQLSSGSTAVIVVNAAHDHAKAARWALERGASVMVEKPLATSLHDVLDLCSYAGDCNGILAAGHVLRFNRYLRTFSDSLPNWEHIQSIKVEWVDSRGEYRYDDTKQYDPSVPVYLDCLPHVVSVLQTIFKALPVFSRLLAIESGGAKVVLELLIGGRPCNVVMQRNASDRVRRVVVKSVSGNEILNFSTEPGVIKCGADEFCADQNWDIGPRPLLSMLHAFLISASGGKIDPRFSLDTALTAIGISEAVTPIYQSSVVPWLVEYLASKEEIDDSTLYAISEIVQHDLNRAKGRLRGTAFVELLRNQLRLSKINTSSPETVAQSIIHLFRDG